MRHKYTNESGFTLIGTIAIFMVLSILAISMISISAASYKTSTVERDDQSAFYIAEAGLNFKEKMLKKQIAEIYEYDDVIEEADFSQRLTNEIPAEEVYEKFEQENAYAEISVEQSSANPYEFQITSTGYIGNQKRTITRSLYVEWNDKYEFVEEDPSGKLPPFAVFTSGNFTMNNGSITGDIGTTSTDEGAISFPGGGPAHNGTIYVPNEDENIVNNKVNNIKPDIKPLDGTYAIPDLPEFPSFPDVPNATQKNLQVSQDINYAYSESKEYNQITISANATLTLDIGNTDKVIVVNHLNLINGHIRIVGEGKLTIYVTDEITMGSASSINSAAAIEKVAQLNIYYKGPKKVVLSGAQTIHGSLYVNQADILLTGGAGFIGNIFSGGKNLEISGGSSNMAQLFFAPNAEFKVSGGGTIKGKVISKTFNNSGGGNIEHQELQFTDGPISPDALGMIGGGANGGGGSPIINRIETGATPTISTGKLQEENN